MHALYSPDRRSAPRYAIDFPIEIRTDTRSFVARTRNLNQQGLAVSARMPPDGIAPGDHLAFSILLNHVSPEGPARLDGTAVVLRMEADGDEVTLALEPEWLMTTPVTVGDAVIGGAGRDDA